MPSPDGAGAAEAVDEAAEAVSNRFGRGFGAGVVGVILVVGLITSAVLYAQAGRIADRQEASLAFRATKILQSSSAALIASVGGASAIVDPAGTVDKQRFDRFAIGTVSSTLLPVLAYVQTVSDSDRQSFERTIGKPITEVVNGSLVSAAERSAYLVVRYMYPESATSTSVVGLDLASEPTLASAAQAAEDSGQAVFSAPITSQPSGQLGFFAIQPLYEPGRPTDTTAARRAAFAGFVSSLAPAQTILSAVLGQLPIGAKVLISDGGVRLAGTDAIPHHGHSVTDLESGRRWTVHLEYRDTDLATVWLMFIATIVLAAAVSLFLWRTVRQTAELRGAAWSVRHLGQLSERLAMAETRAEAIRIILDSAVSTVGAGSAAVALRGSDPGTLLVVTSSDGSTNASASSMLLSSRPSPITDAWNTKNTVFVNDEAAFRGLYAEDEQDRAARNVASMAALPMRRPGGELFGVLAWQWPIASRFGDGTRSTLQATAEVCQQSLYRADLHEQQWSSATALSTLSQRLAVARNVRQIAEALVEVGPEAGGADFVGVGFLDEAQTKFDLFHRRSGGGPQHLEFAVSADGALMAVLRRGQPLEFQNRSQLDRFPVLVELLGTEMKRLVCIPLIDSSKLLRGVIAFMFAAGSHVLVDPGTERRSTIAELTAQTVERAMLYLHEHELVVDLQRQTLADLPDVAGLQIAARYLPSSATIGLGGDWYDVYVLGDGRVGMVIGDVSGHGIDAIADMTEFRTTVSTLLRTNQELGTIAQMSTALLKAQDTTDVRFATAGLMVLDLGAKTLAYVRAGHPPMLVREPGGNVVVLERGGGGPIGVTDVDIAVQTVAVESGSVIVAYTDGLIERRDEPIDIGLDRLLRALGECSSTDLWGGAEAIADVLVEQCLGGRQTADDAAVLVVVVE